MSMFDLHGEVAVVIGATGALGGACARALGAAGAAVAVLGRNEQRGTDCVAAIQSAGGRARFFSCDALKAESLKVAHREVASALGDPGVLINAAGGNKPEAVVSPGRAFEAISHEAWDEVFDLNLVGGVLLPCQEFGPGMVARRKGSIINIASVTSHLPLSRVVAYSAAKAAVLSLSRFLAREWAPQGVRVNTITPGFFPAEQNRKLLFNEDGTPTARTASIWAHTPMGRFGRPEEMGGAAVFLASANASGFVTGADLVVDGGFTAQTI